MARRRHSGTVFATVKTEGGLLPADLLQRVTGGERELKGLTPSDYHLASGERINEAVNRAWDRLLGAWAGFRSGLEKLPEADPATSLTRERWLLVLFQELGYGRLISKPARESGGRSFPISHFWQHVPIHLVGAHIDLDRRTPGVAGAARSSPHSLTQEYLNHAHESLWGFVSNGLRLRVLRDNRSLTRQAYVEFDLEAMMEGEAYADFTLLWLVCHESRVEAERPQDSWLERWAQAAREQGTRALDRLRDGVEEAIRALGRGFLAHPANQPLRERLRTGALSTEDYYRQLLRLVYRLLFLFVAEDRELLLDPRAMPEARERYLAFYSTARLRRLAERRKGTRHPDLYRGLRLVMERLGADEGCPPLGLFALGSFLWSRDAVADLGPADLANRDLLDAVRALAFTVEGPLLRVVDYRNLGSEELGSVYESLLELHPVVNLDAASFDLGSASGHERKTTGSYYTPATLVQCLLDSALDPILDEASRGPEAERRILALKVCDPATGSGHFLIAAAHRIARRLASVRTGDEEPAPEAVRSALRDVIGRCIYGVDVNPMAVELCKVSLWMEAIEPGKPLSFLDHRIRCGNSLLGATPALLEAGIPDSAFQAIEGDDKKVVTALRKQNRLEREGFRPLLAEMVAEEREVYGAIADTIRALDAVDDAAVTGVHEKESRYGRLAGSEQYRQAELIADAWCAAFVWRKTRERLPAITEDLFLRLAQQPGTVPDGLMREIDRVASQYRFSHWHLAFPEVFRVPTDGPPADSTSGWSGGFDVVLGNPPWERVKLQEQEWFASRNAAIAGAPNAAARRLLIQALATEDPPLHAAFLDARRSAEGESHIVRDSGRYPLCGRGDVNTYSIFAESMRAIVAPRGRVGCVLPSGIATDDTTKLFFADLMETKQLRSLYSFFEIRRIFLGTDSRNPFCLLTLSGRSGQPEGAADFAFDLRSVAEIAEQDRHFELTADEIALLNPNTRTCPVFRSVRDAELTKAIYRRVPVLIREGPPEENPWGISFLRMLDMAVDSGLFRTSQQLEADGWRIKGNLFHRNGERSLPLYEAKMVHHYDHRFGDYADRPEGSESTSLPDVPRERLLNPTYAPLSRYWVEAAEVESKLAGKWTRGWLLGWRDISRGTDERTVIASDVPRVGVGDKFLLMLPATRTELVGCLLACLDSFAFDYAARQKLGGTSLKYFTMKQLPVLPPTAFERASSWSGEPLHAWLLSGLLELVFTSWDLECFARDCGYEGPPFRWDDERRFLIRCELDAAFFHLYGLAREEVSFVLDSFHIVKQDDEKAYGEYRTKRVILEVYDAMTRAANTGEPFRTRLEPPPADAQVAHQRGGS